MHFAIAATAAGTLVRRWSAGAHFARTHADVQIATLDDPDAIEPMIQVQAAERIGWMARAHELPAFERYPSKD